MGQQGLKPTLKRQPPGTHQVLSKRTQSEIWVVLVYYLGGPTEEGNDQNHLKPYSEASSWEISPPSRLSIALDPISPRLDGFAGLTMCTCDHAGVSL